MGFGGNNQGGRGGRDGGRERAPDPDLTGYFSDRLGLAIPELAVLTHDEYQAIASRENGHPAQHREWIEQISLWKTTS